MKRLTLLLVIGFVSFDASSQDSKIDATLSTSTDSLRSKRMETKENEMQNFNAYEEVRKALQPYIQSAKTGDGKLSRTAFYGHAHIVGSLDGEVYNMTADEFGGAVSEGGSSENIQHQIVWIDISGPAAAAKVEFIDWGGLRFTDFFVLYKENGQWKISGKVYDSHSRN